MDHLGSINEVKALRFRDADGKVLFIQVSVQPADRTAAIPVLLNNDIFVLNDAEAVLKNKSLPIGFNNSVLGITDEVASYLYGITEDVQEFMTDAVGRLTALENLIAGATPAGVTVKVETTPETDVSIEPYVALIKTFATAGDYHLRLTPATNTNYQIKNDAAGDWTIHGNGKLIGNETELVLTPGQHATVRYDGAKFRIMEIAIVATEVTKESIGLGNVDNTADASKIVASAAKLTTARDINGVPFNGATDITIAPGELPSIVDSKQYVAKNGTWQELVSASGGISHATSDGKIYGSKNGAWAEVTAAALNITNVATADRLATPRLINGVSFDGSANITITAAVGAPSMTTMTLPVVPGKTVTAGNIVDLVHVDESLIAGTQTYVRNATPIDFVTTRPSAGLAAYYSPSNDVGELSLSKIALSEGGWDAVTSTTLSPLGVPGVQETSNFLIPHPTDVDKVLVRLGANTAIADISGETIAVPPYSTMTWDHQAAYCMDFTSDNRLVTVGGLGIFEVYWSATRTDAASVTKEVIAAAAGYTFGTSAGELARVIGGSINGTKAIISFEFYASEDINKTLHCLVDLSTPAWTSASLLSFVEEEYISAPWEVRQAGLTPSTYKIDAERAVSYRVFNKNITYNYDTLVTAATLTISGDTLSVGVRGIVLNHTSEDYAVYGGFGNISQIEAAYRSENTMAVILTTARGGIVVTHIIDDTTGAANGFIQAVPIADSGALTRLNVTATPVATSANTMLFFTSRYWDGTDNPLSFYQLTGNAPGGTLQGPGTFNGGPFAFGETAAVQNLSSVPAAATVAALATPGCFSCKITDDRSLLFYTSAGYTYAALYDTSGVCPSLVRGVGPLSPDTLVNISAIVAGVVTGTTWIIFAGSYIADGTGFVGAVGITATSLFLSGSASTFNAGPLDVDSPIRMQIIRGTEVGEFNLLMLSYVDSADNFRIDSRPITMTDNYCATSNLGLTGVISAGVYLGEAHIESATAGGVAVYKKSADDTQIFARGFSFSPTTGISVLAEQALPYANVSSLTMLRVRSSLVAIAWSSATDAVTKIQSFNYDSGTFTAYSNLLTVAASERRIFGLSFITDGTWLLDAANTSTIHQFAVIAGHATLRVAQSDATDSREVGSSHLSKICDGKFLHAHLIVGGADTIIASYVRYEDGFLHIATQVPYAEGRAFGLALTSGGGSNPATVTVVTDFMGNQFSTTGLAGGQRYYVHGTGNGFSTQGTGKDWLFGVATSRTTMRMRNWNN